MDSLLEPLVGMERRCGLIICIRHRQCTRSYATTSTSLSLAYPPMALERPPHQRIHGDSLLRRLQVRDTVSLGFTEVLDHLGLCVLWVDVVTLVYSNIVRRVDSTVARHLYSSCAIPCP